MWCDVYDVYKNIYTRVKGSERRREKERETERDRERVSGFPSLSFVRLFLSLYLCERER